MTKTQILKEIKERYIEEDTYQTGVLRFKGNASPEEFLDNLNNTLSLFEKAIREETWEKGFKHGFEDCKKMVEKGEHAHCCIVPNSDEIKRLADYLMENYQDQITGGSAVDVAIKILKKNKKA